MNLKKEKVLTFLLLPIFIASCKNNENKSKLNATDIKWEQCDNDTNSTRIRCSYIDVPMNWNDSKSKKIKIKFMKIATKDNNPNSQTLFFNPGGPGGSAIEIGKKLINSDFANNFNIIAVDPRGYNEIKCNQNNLPSKLIAETEDEFEKITKQSLEYINSCYDLSGDIINYIDTKQSAHDLDAIRKILNLEKINFLGVSYGTHLGATYAELFPNNIGKLILDSVANQGILTDDRVRIKANEIKNQYNLFINWCKNSKKCALNSEPNLEQFLNNFLSKDYHLIELKKIYKEEIKEFVLNEIIDYRWIDLSKFLKNYETTKNNVSQINHNITILTNCLEIPKEEFTFSKYLNLRTKSNNIEPIFGNHLVEIKIGLLCSKWSRTGLHEIKKYNINPNQQALILNSENDARTPKENAVNLLNQIPLGRLLTSKEPGHGVFFRTCVKENIFNYLNNNILPNNYTLCEEKTLEIDKSFSLKVF